MLALRGMLGTVGELIGYLWQRKLWWLMPMVVLLLLLGLLIALGSVAGAGPFMYTFF